jgi:type IX secretion system PorP/SprF family membrane protein
MQVRALAKVIVLVMLLPIGVKAQHSIVYSQYLFNGLLINPAYAGSHVQFSGTLTYRNQWVNFPGAPETATLGVHNSFRHGKVGIGLLMTSDRIGSYSNTGFFPSYAYAIKDGRGGVFSMGLQAGFNNYKADYGDLTLKTDQTNQGDDPTFSVFMNEFKPNFGGGIFYYNKKIFAGFSVPTILTNASLFSGNLSQLITPRYYYLNAGLKLPLDPRTKRVILQPSLLVRAQEGTPLSMDFNVNVIFDQLISIGSSFRTGDGAILLLNYKLSEKFYVGYSYDWTTSDIRRFSKGSHEIMINFRTKIRKLHGNIECPHVYSH